MGSGEEGWEYKLRLSDEYDLFGGYGTLFVVVHEFVELCEADFAVAVDVGPFDHLGPDPFVDLLNVAADHHFELVGGDLAALVLAPVKTFPYLVKRGKGDGQLVLAEVVLLV